MQKARKHKLLVILISFCVSVMVIGLVLFSLRKNINLYFTPSELLELNYIPQNPIKLGGMVKEYSVQRNVNTLNINFTVTDFEAEIPVSYQGILPDLFREGKGVVLQGKFIDGTFQASQVLAKHDENYMPPKIIGVNHDS